VCARRVGGFAKVAQQGRCQDVLNERGFARAAHARDTHHAPQRKVHRHVLQVVLARAFQNQAGGGLGHHALEAKPYLFAPAQVRTGEGVCVADAIGRAVEHYLATAFAGAGAHVNETVGSEHDGGVVLHHHQGVASGHQAAHGLVDAVHVARVQADAGLVQHEQGVDQAGAPTQW
jgi:hypothetical protein